TSLPLTKTLVVSNHECSNSGMPHTFCIQQPLQQTSIVSDCPDEARIAGSEVYYPHSLALPEQTKNFKMRLHAIEIIGITLGTLEYSSHVRIRTGQLEDVYHVNLPLQDRKRVVYGETRSMR